MYSVIMSTVPPSIISGTVEVSKKPSRKTQASGESAIVASMRGSRSVGVVGREQHGRAAERVPDGADAGRCRCVRRESSSGWRSRR